MRLFVPTAVIALLFACGDSAPPAPPEPACGLSLDGLAGKSFVMLEALPDGDVENPQARIRFEQREGKLHADYTVKSLVNVYDYTCEKGTGSREELICKSEADFGRLCMALEAHEKGSCTAEAIEKLGMTGDPKKLEEGMKAAKELSAKAYELGGAQLERWQLMNNNVANAIHGKLYIKVDERSCRLQLDDMFVTVHDGKKKEDFNPVGSNAFVESSETWLWEDCNTGRMVADLDSAELPPLDQIPPDAERLHEAGKPVHLHYLGKVGTEAKEGCTYAADIYKNWKPVGMGSEPKVEGGKVTWHFQQAIEASEKISLGGGRRGAVVTMVRHQTCDGKKEEIDVVCADVALK